MTENRDIFSGETFSTLLSFLQDQDCADSADSVDAWPVAQISAMVDAGVMDWDIPVDFGGLDLPADQMLTGLKLLSSADLVSTFILTQRSAAVRRIATSENRTAKNALLPALKSGQIFATVGISHLTTSGQHLRDPLVSVLPTEDGYRMNGTVPWATGATMADYLITGGTLDDGREILAAVPTAHPGLQVQPPVNLMALNASQTGAVTLHNVTITKSDVLHGPVEGVMQKGTGGGAGSLGTSALAIGATSGTLQQMELEAEKRPELTEFIEPMQQECNELNAKLQLAAAGAGPDSAAVEDLRRRANSLVLRSAQSWLAATKGAGYVAGHPAERAVRQSMFFLVWSCPQPVLAGNLRELACATK